MVSLVYAMILLSVLSIGYYFYIKKSLSSFRKNIKIGTKVMVKYNSKFIECIVTAVQQKLFDNSEEFIIINGYPASVGPTDTVVRIRNVFPTNLVNKEDVL
jgi:hypothetical protein